MESTLKKYFGFSKFRPYQREIVESILQGKDCLVVMATGSGKSLCYQVPPLISKKTAVVISPLISLMQDQVMSLKQRDIRAEYLSSAQNDLNAYTNAERGRYDILYMTPEKACTLPSSFWSNLLAYGICLLAVDEAHCISEWGHNFRVEYKQLDKLRTVLVNVPFVGLTATATEKVRDDIVKSLKLEFPRITIGSFDRHNLFYNCESFTRGSAFLNKLATEISSIVDKRESSIIYCTAVKDVEELFATLKEAGIQAGMYHGQMSNKAREDFHRSFIRDEFYVMVATIAFGMGIDKPDIRHVIHYGCPKSLESYYQESGRCGRDGVSSYCRLYYTRSDFGKADFYCSEARTADQRKAILDSFAAAQRYCMVTSCRRKFLLEYFGEKCSSSKCGTCDNCTSLKEEIDMSRDAFLLMACIQSCKGHWGLNLPVDVLRGSRSKKILDANLDKIPFHGLGKDMSANWWKALASQLISRDYLIETFKDIYKNIRVGPIGIQFLNSCNPDYQPLLYLTLTPELAGDDVSGDATGNSVSNLSQEFELSEAEDMLYKMLIEERMKLAKEHGTAPYALCGDQTLRRITLTRPSTRARLANIDGVNQHFLKTYGDRLLQIIKQLSQELVLHLDGGEPIAEPSMPSKVASPIGGPRPILEYATIHKNKRLTPSKFEAWKMWQEGGLTIQKISNHPSRAAPIKEQTVMEYLVEAGREGYSLDWARLCLEVGLTQETLKHIQEIGAKFGTSKLKPIKDELPEEVSYTQIKVGLAMQEMRISLVDSADHKVKVESTPNDNSGRESDDATLMLALENADDLTCSRKRQKVDEPQAVQSVAMKSTEESVLDWLKNFKDGVLLSDILEHFNGSSVESVIDILNCLEAEFVIFKKNDRYRLL